MPAFHLCFPGEGDFLIEDIGDVLTIGSAADNMVQLDHPSVAPHHARLHVVEDHFVLEDLESAGGTFVNGQSVSAARVDAGSAVRFGEVHALVHPHFQGGNEEAEDDVMFHLLGVRTAFENARARQDELTAELEAALQIAAELTAERDQLAAEVAELRQAFTAARP